MSRDLVSRKPQSEGRRTAIRKPRRRIPGSHLDCCLSLDDLGYIEDVNPDGARFLRRTRDSLLRIPFAALVGEQYRGFWLRHFISHRQPGGVGTTRLVLNIGMSKRTVEVSTETSASLGKLHFKVRLQESSWAQDHRTPTGEVPAGAILHIQDFVAMVDRSGNVRFTNQSILDRSPRETVGTSFYDYVRPYDTKRFRMAIEQAFASAATTEFVNEGLVCFPDGKHFRVRVNPLTIENTTKRAKETLGTETAMIVLADITVQQHAEQELHRIQNDRRRFARRANVIREEERRRLASELHDQLGQNLTALKIDLSLAGRKVNTLERTRLAIRSAESTVDHLIDLVRELSAELRPPLIDDLGLIAALQFQIETFEKRTGIRATFKTQTGEVVTSSEIAMGIFRVFQEAMTNIVRHSGASHVEVVLDVHQGWLFLIVSDNGRGITEEELCSPKSLGLTGMRERAEQLGGVIQIRNGLTEGTTVVMQVPLSAGQRRSLRSEPRLKPL